MKRATPNLYGSKDMNGSHNEICKLLLTRVFHKTVLDGGSTQANPCHQVRDDM